jgi:hypothetical protein
MSDDIASRVHAQREERKVADHKYRHRVMDAQKLATSNPEAYKMRVLLVAALGYAFIVGALALVLGVFGFCLWGLLHSRHGHYAAIKGAIIFGALGFIILKALWVKTPEVEGVELKRQDAPKLFEILDDFCAKLKTRIDRVMVTTDYTAAVEQRPRLGLLGFEENILYLGIPYMLTMTPEQFRGTLCHEMGHLTNSHGTFGTTIYRIRMSWHQVLASLAESSPGFFNVFFAFFKWYMPYFEALTFSLARNHEEQADAEAAKFVDRTACAERFIRVAMNYEHIGDNFWKNVGEMRKTEKEPPRDIYVRMADYMRQSEIDPVNGKKWLTEALERETDFFDPHPSFCERIAVLQVPQYDPERLKQQGPPAHLLSTQRNFGDEVLGRALINKIAGELSKEFYDNNKLSWFEEYNRYEEDRKMVAEFEKKRETQELDKEELRDYYSVMHALHGYKACRHIAEEAMQRFPDEGWSYAALAYHKYEEDDPSFVGYLEKAMSMHSRFVQNGCQTMIAYYKKCGDTEKVKHYTTRLDEHEAHFEMAELERAELKDSDLFDPHELNNDVVIKLRAIFDQHREVEHVYIARKVVRYMPEYPHYVFGVKTGFLLISQERDQELYIKLEKELAYQFAESFYMVILDGKTKQIEEKLKRTEIALV